ncbi:MAG: 30S ribosomal protein S16 [Candidatus Omnitrophica bacterium]|nr:30S ribosomal protein S16 [Candidatus Omnitrophota bacterium]
MVVVRLQRRGTKKMPHHRIVVTDRSRSQRGRILETIGYYDPSFHPARLKLDTPRLQHWVSSGAQVSLAVVHLIKSLKAPAGTAASS